MKKNQIVILLFVIFIDIEVNDYMSWTNYHSHTCYCDGKNIPEDYIIEAINQGLIAYGYSSHAPVPFQCEWTIPEQKIGTYIIDVNKIKEKYKDRIQVYLGLEVDYIPGVTGPNYSSIREYNLDYCIGAIHFVDMFPNGERWCIDWTYDFFIKGITEIFNRNVIKAVKRFFELTKYMLYESKPDMIGHFDKIRMHNVKNSLFNENESWFKKEIEEVLKLIKSKDIIVEINTRGYYNNGVGLYPSPSFYQMIKKLDIPISINSDSHKPNEITKGYQHAARILQNEGIDQTWILIDGSWKPFYFDSVKGIYL